MWDLMEGKREFNVLINFANIYIRQVSSRDYTNVFPTIVVGFSNVKWVRIERDPLLCYAKKK